MANAGSKHQNYNARAQAALDTIGLHYRAELAEALLSEKLPPRMKLPDDVLKRVGKNVPPPVVEVLMRPHRDLTTQQRRRLAKRLMTSDIQTKQPLNARDRLKLRRWV